MAVLPTDVFEDLSLETVDTVQGIFIPLASLPALTASEANPTTGDGREVLRALVQTAYNNISSLPTPPTKMGAIYDEATITETRRRQDFTFSFNVIIPQTAYAMESE